MGHHVSSPLSSPFFLFFFQRQEESVFSLRWEMPTTGRAGTGCRQQLENQLESPERAPETQVLDCHLLPPRVTQGVSQRPHCQANCPHFTGASSWHNRTNHQESRQGECGGGVIAQRPLAMLRQPQEGDPSPALHPPVCSLASPLPFI